MNVYLDMCSIERPHDAKSQIRIRLEAEAIIDIISLCEAGAVDLLTSDIHVYELNRNPRPHRKNVF